MSSRDGGLARHGPVLLDLARRSIAHGLEHGGPLGVDPEEFPPELRERRASFTTLKLNAELRGCVGGLEARRPLVCDVARSAYAAGFDDPRFPRLSAAELEMLSIHLAVLGPLERLEVVSEEDLLAKIRPGVDGLVLRDGPRQGTFLPAVWESLPDPREFVRHLQHKAQLGGRPWSPSWEILRYTVESID